MNKEHIVKTIKKLEQERFYHMERIDDIHEELQELAIEYKELTGFEKYKIKGE